MPPAPRWLIVGLVCVSPAVAQAALDSLYQRVAADLKQGRPLVVTVHVALCDNSIIWCGRVGTATETSRDATSTGGRRWAPRLLRSRARLQARDGRPRRREGGHRARRLPATRDAPVNRLAAARGDGAVRCGAGRPGLSRAEIARASDAMIRQTLRDEGEKLRLPTARGWRSAGADTSSATPGTTT